ncbi:signal peptidase, endoplasmic reticulum-type [Halomicrobium zhouii]|uniref:Signal peptidase, endoplasmic reticulum-type n=1 Tax=Halomicrobium zhouii TaxID=767519 RepID=A0A1I6K590_9EURY|nr:S26 family signal peptidase [Halomicrobium zhouii]SFR86000.1 signal peptidase, endoplasmic reticulum-type [Halomicrobium zhouii]
MSDSRGPNPPDRPEDPSWRVYLADLASSVLSVGLVVCFLFAISGVWPPMVAVESESMAPHMAVGDLVFVMDEARFPGDGAHGETGVVTARSGAETGYATFGGSGDVVVFAPDGNDDATPVIHRAMFWVADGENWYDEANPEFVGDADSCVELRNCPAPHAGFVTKGDNARTNPGYDQAQGMFAPVRPEWIVGTAEARLPWLGCLRLRASGPERRPDACELPVG